jgi:hypothetical protein
MVRDNTAIFKAVFCAHAISLYRPSEREYRKADTKKKSSASIQVSTQTDMKLSKGTSTLIVFTFFLYFPSSLVNQIWCSLYHIFSTLHHIRWFHIALSIFSTILLPQTSFLPINRSLSLTNLRTHIHTDPQTLNFIFMILAKTACMSLVNIWNTNFT